MRVDDDCHPSLQGPGLQCLHARFLQGERKSFGYDDRESLLFEECRLRGVDMCDEGGRNEENGDPIKGEPQEVVPLQHG